MRGGEHITKAVNGALSSSKGLREQVVLLFHGIGQPPAHVPSDERPYWVELSFFRDIVAMVRSESFDREVVFTFDDGNRSDLVASEELSRAGLQGHFFLLAGRLGATNFLDAGEARALTQTGMEVGLHGHSHVNWRRLAPAGWRAEIVDARARIAEAIGRPVTSVAIPYGSYDRKVLHHLQQQHFERIYTADRGPTLTSSSIIRRTAVMRRASLDDVRDIIEDNCGPLRRVRRKITPWIKSWR